MPEAPRLARLLARLLLGGLALLLALQSQRRLRSPPMKLLLLLHSLAAVREEDARGVDEEEEDPRSGVQETADDDDDGSGRFLMVLDGLLDGRSCFDFGFGVAMPLFAAAAVLSESRCSASCSRFRKSPWSRPPSTSLALAARSACAFANAAAFFCAQACAAETGCSDAPVGMASASSSMI